jgi:hypothetical protein
LVRFDTPLSVARVCKKNLGVQFQDSEWKGFPFLRPRCALRFFSVWKRFEGCVAGKSTKNEGVIAQQLQRNSARSVRLGKRLDPDLKSWLDDVIIPALVRDYLAEIQKRNKLATMGSSEVTSDVGR